MEPSRVLVPETLSVATIAAFVDALARAEREPSRVAVVESAAGGVFCRGLDLASVSGEGERGAAARAQAIAVAFARCLETLRGFPKPTIAAVRGEALGGGLGIAAACDLVVATESASFGLPETLFGLLPATVLPVLLERMAPQKARLLALSAQACDAVRARDLGLADDVVTPGELETALRRWVRVLARSGPRAVGTIKRMTAEASGLLLDDALGRAAVASGSLARDPAVLGAIREFLADGVAPWLRDEEDP